MKKTYLQPELMIEIAEAEASILTESLGLYTVGHPGYEDPDDEDADGGWAPKDNLWEF